MVEIGGKSLFIIKYQSTTNFESRQSREKNAKKNKTIKYIQKRNLKKNPTKTEKTNLIHEKAVENKEYL